MRDFDTIDPMPLRCTLSHGRLGIALVLGLAVSACNGDGGREAGTGNVAAPPAPESRTLPSPRPELGRAELLSAVDQAASAYAAGTEDRLAQAELAGRRFALRIRFGCKGSRTGENAAALAWSYDEDDQALRLRATPDITLEPARNAVDGGPVEAIEGFWIPRPWLLSVSCPARAEDEPAFSSESTIGIAQYFTPEDSRVERRSGRPYEALKKVSRDDVPLSGGFNFVLSGRLEPSPEGRVIDCQSGSADSRPRCIISAKFDRIAFENPADGIILAEWGTG